LKNEHWNLFQVVYFFNFTKSELYTFPEAKKTSNLAYLKQHPPVYPTFLTCDFTTYTNGLLFFSLTSVETQNVRGTSRIPAFTETSRDHPL